MKFFVCGLTLLVATFANASSPEAWDNFRDDVKIKCQTASQMFVTKANVTVDPFGSEKYGVAIVFGESNDSGSAVALVCLYDKQTKDVALYAKSPIEPPEAAE